MTSILDGSSEGGEGYDPLESYSAEMDAPRRYMTSSLDGSSEGGEGYDPLESYSAEMDAPRRYMTSSLDGSSEGGGGVRPPRVLLCRDGCTKKIHDLHPRW